MDGQVRLRTLIDREASAKAVKPVPRAPAPIAGLFQHFDSEEQRQQHLRDVEAAQRDHAAPF